MLYLREVRYRHTGRREREKQAKSMKITKRPDGIFCWIDGNTVGNADYNTGGFVTADNHQKTGNWYCGCMRFKIKDPCKHVREIQRRLGKFEGEGVVSTHRTLATPAEGNDGNGGKITNECGSNEAKKLQNKLNGQLNKSGNNGNGDAKSPSLTGGLSTQITTQLDITDPFQESEQNDIDQIEGRRNGELAWKLSNGEYVISYAGVMKLAEKHHIEFSVSLRPERSEGSTNTVIAKASNGNERISGKEVKRYKYATTASELAKRNAARQLLPLPEIKAIEHKAKLNAEFDWQKAQAKCAELVGPANVNIIIRDLVSAGKLRQDNPSHYDRTEWRIIYDACEKDAEVTRDPESLNRWSYNSAEFIDKCKDAIEQVRAEKKSVEANEMPSQRAMRSTTPSTAEGVRKLQMDKKLRTWLIEADGTKTEISCREICEQFEDGSIITRLRAGIDSGADISTVELDD